MSWHGAYIVFYKYEDGKAVKHKMYIDQIMTGSSKQDSLSVMAMVEALVVQLQHMFPQMEDIWLQSDNASQEGSDSLHSYSERPLLSQDLSGDSHRDPRRKGAH
jgi:hypothetical protein